MALRTTREYGMAVRRIREEAGLTQEELAKRAGVSRRWIINLENGKPNVDFALVLDCLAALGAGLRVSHEDGTPWQF